MSTRAGVRGAGEGGSLARSRHEAAWAGRRRSPPPQLPWEQAPQQAAAQSPRSSTILRATDLPLPGPLPPPSCPAKGAHQQAGGQLPRSLEVLLHDLLGHRNYVVALPVLDQAQRLQRLHHVVCTGGVGAGAEAARRALVRGAGGGGWSWVRDQAREGAGASCNRLASRGGGVRPAGARAPRRGPAAPPHPPATPNLGCTPAKARCRLTHTTPHRPTWSRRHTVSVFCFSPECWKMASALSTLRT